MQLSSTTFLRTATLLLAAIVFVNGSRTWHRRQHHHSSDLHRRAIHDRTEIGEKVVFAFIAASNTSDVVPNDIDLEAVTHIVYSAGNVDPFTGSLSVLDNITLGQSDLNSTANATVSENDLTGYLGDLYQLKLQNRHIKVLLSVGGSGSAETFQFITNTTSRATFVANATQIIRDYALDGIDIDYEFPTTNEEGQGFADLLTALRDSFDLLQFSRREETPYLLTATVSFATNNSVYYKIPQMNAALNYWNVMAYNYSGNWNDVSDNHANLFGGQSSGLSTDGGINWFISNGASPQKITLGLPLFGQTFENTTGMGQPFNATLSGNASLALYKDLPYEGAVVFENLTDISSYSYDEATLQLISFDTPNITELKAQYILNKGLAGAAFLDLSMDKPGNDSLVKVVADKLVKLDSTENHIDFPDSKFDNVREFMGLDCGTLADAEETGSSASSFSASISAVTGLPSSTRSCVSSSATESFNVSSSGFSTIFASSTQSASSFPSETSLLDPLTSASSSSTVTPSSAFTISSFSSTLTLSSPAKSSSA